MKKRIFSGIQPSGVIHIGNYFGAIKQWVELQNEAEELFFCIVDLHAITVPQNPAELKENIYRMAALYLAAGINPKKSKIFVQSSRPEHTELAWLLSTITDMGELTQMTQLKDKAYKDINDIIKSKYKGLELNIFESGIKPFVRGYNKKLGTFTNIETGKDRFLHYVPGWVNAGLVNYPILMAADILLYHADGVPVGEDQKQHVELTRNLAIRFNNKYGNTFTVPEPIIKKISARIMGLDDPKKKMSKSASTPLNYIAMTDDAETIKQKIRKAVKDSGNEIKRGADKPAMTNLLNIFSEVTNKEISQIEKEFVGKSYSEFKEELAEAIVSYFAPIQKKYSEFMNDKANIKKILAEGSDSIAPLAQKTLKEVKEKVGLGI